METGKVLKVIGEEEISVKRFPFTTLSTKLNKIFFQICLRRGKYSYFLLLALIEVPDWSVVRGWGGPGECHVPKQNWTSFVSHPSRDKYSTCFAILIESLNIDSRGSVCSNTLKVLGNARLLLPLPNKSSIAVRPLSTTGLGSIAFHVHMII